MTAPGFHIDLEPALLASVRALVAGELAQDFPKAARSRGDLLAAEHLVDGRLDTDEARAEVRDKGEKYKVRLTLPVFGGPSLTQCACGKHLSAQGEPRCAHVLATWKTLAAELEDLADKQLRQDDHGALFAAMDDFMGGDDATGVFEAPAEAARTDGIRIVWRVDETLDLAPYLQTRLGEAPWTRGRRLGWGEFTSQPALWSAQADHLAAARVKPRRLGNQDDFEVDVFGLLEDLDGHPLVFWAADDQVVAVEAGSVGLAARAADDGIVVASHINAVPVERQWIFAGQGYVTLAGAPRRLLFSRCNAATTDFLTKLERSAKPVPLAEKERLLAYLVRLEQRLAVAVEGAIVEPTLAAGSELLHARLTPMQPSGIKVELLVRPAPAGGYFPVGMGPETVLDVTDPAAPRNVARNLERETDRARELVEALELMRLPCVHGHIWFLRTDDAALDFVGALNAYAVRHAYVAVEWPQYAQKSYEQAEPLAAQSFHIAVGEGRDWFDVKGTVDVDGQLVELAELIAAIKRKTRYVRLKDGRWTKVTALFESRLAKLTGLLETTKDGLAIPAASLPALAELDLEKERVEIRQASDDFKRASALFKRARDMPCPLPEGFGATLRPYQQEGYAWMARLAAWGMGACLADDMGLGKTVQTLAVLLRLAPDGPSIVVAPTSVSPNWAKEAKRFAPDLNVIMYRDTDRGQILKALKPGDLLLVSYGLVQRDADKLAAVPWAALVLDEAQAVKNFHTKTAQAIRAIGAQWRVALTGTPIENNLSELWSIFRIVAPGMLGPWEAFKKSYAVPIERFAMEGARTALQTRLSPFILRRLKEDLLTELPPKTEIDITVELSDDERRIYDAVRISAMRDIEAKAKTAEDKGETPDTRLAVLAALTKLRQIACHPRLFDPDWAGPSAKLTAFVETCRGLKENGHKALVFSQFTSHLALLGDALTTLGARFLYLDGSVPQAQRGELVERFQAGEADFFLISVKAGGTGLTLTKADYVLHMDPWWNPAVEDQATDRAHRIGQTKPLTVYRFVAAGTVEEKILQLHAAKRELVEMLLAGGKTAAALPADELIRLLASEPLTRP